MIRVDPNLEVRLADVATDIRAAQHLRYRVFVDELRARPQAVDHESKLEIDAFDPFVQHLCLVDLAREQAGRDDYVVGVYRLIDENSAEAIGGFYSQSEFNIEKVLGAKGRKLELGRSCIDADYRGGAAMAMLWSALGQYVKEKHIDIMFGAASFPGTEIAPKAQSLSLLNASYLAPETLRATVLAEHGVAMNIVPQMRISKVEAMRDMPSLIKAYLRLGGSIGDGAYVDHQFNTVDVFVLMETKMMVNKFKAMYTK